MNSNEEVVNLIEREKKRVYDINSNIHWLQNRHKEVKVLVNFRTKMRN